ncbi:MAG: PAS domain-containing sensor histidine kinase [Geobacteraceae bacterium GWC2_58_44]|nr:MAG: PAS domain-containing sensor histidine kinase [Geobacteraceae bacterium GWC2_58_44]
MRIETKKLSAIMLISAITVAFTMMVANHLVLRQIRAEAVRQASRQQESSMKTFWELMNRRGGNFRIEDGKLLIGEFVLNGNNEMPDKVFSITGSRATVFLGDTRIATNVPQSDGSRAIGTKLVGPAYEAVYRQGIPYRGEAQILGIPYFTAYDPIRDALGEIIGTLFVGVKQDEYLASYNRINLKIRAINGTLAAVFVLFAFLLLSERQRSADAIQKQLNFLQVLYDTVPIPIFSRDAGGRYNGCNKTFQSFLGLAREEVIGKTVHDVWPKEYADLYHRMDLELLEHSGTQVYESRIRHADGSIRDVVHNRAALQDHNGVPEGLVGVILDITERKAAEEERNKLEAQRHHSRIMESLMAQLSHDLKTPLTPLFALIPMIRRKVSDPQLERMLEICQQSVNQIKGLAVKSLDLVRLSSEANRPVLVPVALARAADAALREVAAPLSQRGVSCLNGIDPALQVLGAADQLVLLFRNLLSNAARYAARDGTVRIGAALIDGTVQVSVQDDGVGLDPSHTSLIFHEFFKADAARQDLNTQGLGLAICQRIVANHGGSIWALSPGRGRGTTILFTLTPSSEACEAAIGS